MHKSILISGDSQRSEFPIRLWDICPPYRLGHIVKGFHSLNELYDVPDKVLPIGVFGDAIHARGFVGLLLVMRPHESYRVHPVYE